MFDHSPGHIAAYHVLHRLSTPRHPPCALTNLTTLMRSWSLHGQAAYMTLEFLTQPSPTPPSDFRPNKTSRTAESEPVIVSTFNLPSRTSPPDQTSCVRLFDCQRASPAGHTDPDRAEPPADPAGAQLGYPQSVARQWVSAGFFQELCLVFRPGPTSGPRAPHSPPWGTGPSQEVEPIGLEPTTSWLQTRRSPN